MKLPRLDQPKGREATRLRQRRADLLRSFTVPADALPGSLSLTHTRCGRDGCHCAESAGHPVWRLRFQRAGKPHLETIPTEWIEDVQRRVAAGRVAQEMLVEVLTVNAELLALEKEQRSRKTRGRMRSVR